MKQRFKLSAGVVASILAIGIAVPIVFAAEFSRDDAARYILATAKAFRTVYAKQIVAQAAKSNVKPDENWTKDDHAIMLPAQFLKAAGSELKDFELSLVGLTPIYKENLPKTKAETEALQKLMASPATPIPPAPRKISRKAISWEPSSSGSISSPGPLTRTELRPEGTNPPAHITTEVISRSSSPKNLPKSVARIRNNDISMC